MNNKEDLPWTLTDPEDRGLMLIQDFGTEVIPNNDTTLKSLPKEKISESSKYALTFDNEIL
jgi:hypothetical protein